MDKNKLVYLGHYSSILNELFGRPRILIHTNIHTLFDEVGLN